MGWVLGFSVDQEAVDQKIAACGSSYNNSSHFPADEKKGLAKQDLS
jgi:hypothetical protein